MTETLQHSDVVLSTIGDIRADAFADLVRSRLDSFFTRTQVGVAVFSELITYSIDLVRLRRIALRAVAVDPALSGADFIDVFRLRLDAVELSRFVELDDVAMA